VPTNANTAKLGRTVVHYRPNTLTAVSADHRTHPDLPLISNDPRDSEMGADPVKCNLNRVSGQLLGGPWSAHIRR
jgi:hypothetical protein